MPVTAIYAGVLGLWVVFLALRVAQARVRHQVSLGDGGVKALLHASRAHGNAVETIPLALLLLGLAEMAGAPVLALHLLGVTLLVGRGLHGLYFFGGARVLPLRSAGMGLTALVLAVLSAGLLGYGIVQGIEGMGGGVA